MKRSNLIIFFVGLSILLLTKEIAGAALKAFASIGGSCKLTYRSLSFDSKGITLQDPILLDLANGDDSKFHLHAKTIWLGWDGGVVWYVQQPEITIALEDLLAVSNIQIPFQGKTSDGIIVLKGGELPNLHFEYEKNGEEEFACYTDRIVCSYKGLQCKEGAAWLRMAKEKIEGAFSNIQIASKNSSVCEITDASFEYAPNVGGKWEWKGKSGFAGGLFPFEGSGIFSQEGEPFGAFNFGKAQGKVHANRLSWDSLSAKEGNVLQSLFCPIFPVLGKVVWDEGLVSGEVEKMGAAYLLTQLSASGISMQHFGCKSLKKDFGRFEMKGGWFGKVGKKWNGVLDLEEGRFDFEGDFLGQPSFLTTDRLQLHETKINGKIGPLEHLSCVLHLFDQGFQIDAVKGSLQIDALKDKFDVWAPFITWNNGNTSFDIRIEQDIREYLRLVGHEDKGIIHFDPVLCRLLGSSFSATEFSHEKGCLLSGHAQAHLTNEQWNVLSSKIKKINPSWFQGEASIHVGFTPLGGTLEIEGPNLVFGQYALPLHLKVQYLSNTLSLCLNEAKLSLDPQSNLRVDKLMLPLKPLHPNLSGSVEASGIISYGKHGTEGDIELGLSQICWEEKPIDIHGPVHAFYSSQEGLLIQGLEGSVQTKEGPIFAKANRLQILPTWEEIKIEKGHLHCPASFLPLQLSSGGTIDCWGDFQTNWDFSAFRGSIVEANLPVRLERAIFSKAEGRFLASGTLLVPAGNAQCNIDVDSNLKGRLTVQEVGVESAPLEIDATFYPQLKIHSAHGNFAGIDLHFQETGPDPLLVGSLDVDFQRLSGWLPEEVGAAFTKLEMGQGYFLKGELKLPNYDWKESIFQGICVGKNCDLFGFNLRSLFTHATFDRHQVTIEHLSVADPAGIGHVDQILVKEGIGHAPWTIAISNIQLQDLRPSLLHARDETVGPLTPLLVRKLDLGPIHGLAADGKTYQGTGHLQFINTFKREESVLDWPSRFFGRIIGLDFDLMTPVRGFLDFELRDGYYWLKQLKEAYSENDRSKFFLVEDPPPRMDLDGNLEILIKMKQYVLFKITDAFVISIDGKLNNPKFRLQKKGRLS